MPVGIKTLFSRRKKSLCWQFPYIAEALADLPAGTVVDRELVVPDESGHCNLVSRRRNLAMKGRGNV